MHYWAADVITHGKKSPFGEHEIDYILFVKAKVNCAPNGEEVSDFKYVTQNELKEMMDPGYYNFDINDFDINLTRFSSLASTNATITVAYRAAYDSLLDVSR